MTASTKKFTMSSLKSFINKNKSTLKIQTSTRFDGMYDCVMPTEKNDFSKVVWTTSCMENTLGVNGAWFVSGSRNSLYPKYNESGKVTEVHVYNCCGSFTLKA